MVFLAFFNGFAIIYRKWLRYEDATKCAKKFFFVFYCY